MLQVRSYTVNDIEQLIDIQRECFPPPYPEEQLWNPQQLLNHIQLFPEGALCVEAENGQLVASCTALKINWHAGDPSHVWAEIADNGYIRTHQHNGNTMYGIDMAVRPSWKRQGVARLLYQARFDVVRRLHLEQFLAGGRITGYHLYKEQLTAEEYVAKVINHEIDDPVLTPQLRAGLTPVQLMHDYLPDEESCNYAVLLIWKNPEFVNE